MGGGVIVSIVFLLSYLAFANRSEAKKPPSFVFANLQAAVKAMPSPPRSPGLDSTQLARQTYKERLKAWSEEAHLILSSCEGQTFSTIAALEWASILKDGKTLDLHFDGKIEGLDLSLHIQIPADATSKSQWADVQRGEKFKISGIISYAAGSAHEEMEEHWVYLSLENPTFDKVK